jgi:Peptidase S46
MMKKMLAAALGAAALAAIALGTALADEGMWTFDHFPAATVKERLGVTIDPQWLARVRGAAVRLSSGCSASVVSGDGLVLSNHHCVRECAQQLSSQQVDYIASGFMAAKRSEEKLCPGMQAEILTSISDVTSVVQAGTAGKSGEQFVKARDGAIAAIEKRACENRQEKFRCQVITLYEGGVYALYTYRKYSDVRLVMAPEMQTAFFGGDPDNFNFPRYDLDFSFVRLYENGKPVATPDHLRWSFAPPKPEEPAFVVGNPGSTSRLLTAEQLDTIRDLRLPWVLIRLSELRGRLIRFSEETSEHARIADFLLFGVENSFKAYYGQQKALVTSTLIADKRRADQALRARTAEDAKLAASIGDPWGEIARAQVQLRALYMPYVLEESGAATGSQLFGYARDIVRAAQERHKPNSERLPDYTDSQLPLVEKSVLDPAPVYPELEQVTLEFWLSKLREYLTADAPATRTFLGKDSPEMLSAALARSRLGDAAYRKQLWNGGLAAVQGSDDPMIRFILRTDPSSRAVRKAWEQRVSGPTDRAAERIAKARFAVYGTSIYPDATFSLRISFGKVAGWTENGTQVPPFTYLGGLWTRATGQFPFNLAPRWQRGESQVDAHTVFDFTTTNDIIGGNSGSPVVNASGEVMGAIFDSNIDALGGDFGYDGSVNRSVAVSTAAISEALRHIYDQPGLLKELSAG